MTSKAATCFTEVIDLAELSGRQLTTPRGLEGLAACAEVTGAADQAAALLDEALQQLGTMTPLYAARLRQRRTAIDRTA